MRPLQELPISPAPAPSGTRRAEVVEGAVPRLSRRVGCVIGVIAGVLWWGGLLWYVLGAGASAGAWTGWVAAGGWGLGLIPLHAVPAHVRGPRRRGSRARRADLAV